MVRQSVVLAPIADRQLARRLGSPISHRAQTPLEHQAGSFARLRTNDPDGSRSGARPPLRQRNEVLETPLILVLAHPVHECSSLLWHPATSSQAIERELAGRNNWDPRLDWRCHWPTRL